MVPILVTACCVLAAALAVLVLRFSRQRAQWREHVSRLQAEHDDALQSLRTERHAIFNALSDAFLLIDGDGHIQFANTLASELFSGRDLLNCHLDEIFLDARLSTPIRQAIEKQIQVTTEVILPQHASPLGTEDRRGESAWMIDAGPIRSDQTNRLTRVLLRDATTEHRTEQVRKDFVANASHELRTPLAIINGYLENLLDDGVLDDPDASRRFLRIMQKHGQRITRIVEDMLVISRLESGEAGSLTMKPFHLGACVQDVLERLESVITSQGAKVKLSTDRSDIRIIGDRFYWTQVLFNLVENALKQNPEIPLRINVGWRAKPDGTLAVWVADNGVGIPAGDLPFIFRRFYRVEKHHSQIEVKGTGLGLSIVKRAVEAHGGEIEVTSTPGQETRFEISLPEAALAQPETVEEAKAS